MPVSMTGLNNRPVTERNEMTDSHESRKDRGSVAVIAALVFVPLALMLALVVDAGRTWVERTALQNGVEAAATATAQTWANGGTGCSPEDLALISDNNALPDDIDCELTGTPRNGIVKVTAQEDVDLIFGGLLGRSTTQINASTAVAVGAPTSLKGLWPFALCVDHPAVGAWLASGMVDPMIAEISFAADGDVCGGEVSGNWTVLNFSGGSSSNAQLKEIVVNGYDGWIEVLQDVSGNPGAPSTALDLPSVYGRTIILPLFDNPRLQGSNALYRIRGFATARLINAQLSGPSSQRGFTIQFESGVLSGGVGNDSSFDFGTSAWAVCSFDEYGEC
jgi:hypothetical protein